MTRILLFDPDVAHAEALAMLLRGSGREVICCSDQRMLARRLRERTFDAVILYSYRSGDWKLHLAEIWSFGKALLAQPAVICFARGYRGPQERVEAEQRGVRLVYEG